MVAIQSKWADRGEVDISSIHQCLRFCCFALIQKRLYKIPAEVQKKSFDTSNQSPSLEPVFELLAALLLNEDRGTNWLVGPVIESYSGLFSRCKSFHERNSQLFNPGLLFHG